MFMVFKNIALYYVNSVKCKKKMGIEDYVNTTQAPINENWLFVK